MRFAHRLTAAVTVLAAAAAPAALAGPAAARTTAPPGAATRLWAARFDGGTARTSGATSVAASPDGSTVYVTGNTSLGGSTPMNTYDTVAYNAATGATLWVARYRGVDGRHPNIAPDITVSPDGSKVFVFGHMPLRGFGERGAFAMLAYNAATGAQLWSSLGTCQEPAHAIAVSPDSSTVYVTGTLGRDYCTLAYNSSTGAVLWQANYPAGQYIHTVADSLALSPDGSDLYVTGTIGTVAYSASTGTQLWADHYKQRWDRSHLSIAVSPGGSGRGRGRGAPGRGQA